MEDFKVRIPGSDFYLKSNTTYRVENRVDMNAPVAKSPTGEQVRLNYKFPDPEGNSENTFMPFDRERNIWDTGFYETSPCYRRQPNYTEEAKKTVEILKNYLLPELEIVLPEGALSHAYTNRHWDEYFKKIKADHVYATDTPEGFLTLWMAFLSGTVVSLDQKSSPRANFLQTPFIIHDRNEKINTDARKGLERDLAKAKFLSLMSSEHDHEKEFVIDVLDYLNFKVNKKSDITVLNTLFNNWVQNKDTATKNAEVFNRTIKEFSTEEGKEELEIFKMLKKGLSEGTVIKENGKFLLEKTPIGTTLKQAAKEVNKKKDLKSKLLQVIE